MKLKQLPEDFIVKEIADIKLAENGRYACFMLKKRNWATTAAIERIASFLNKNPRIFSNSGMKDKNAVTEQYVSAYGLGKADIERVKIRGIQLKLVGFLEKPIGLGAHTANSFEITARDLEKPLKEIRYFCNYYDDQRFGGIRPNMAEVGALIVKRKWEEAMKSYLLYPFDSETEEHKQFRRGLEKSWGRVKASIVPKYLAERKAVEWLEKHPDDYIGAFRALPKQISTLFIHAYQSKLFNEMLAAYAGKYCRRYNELRYCLGRLVMSGENLNIKLPLAGYDFRIEDVDERAGQTAKEVLEGADFRLFKIEAVPYLSSRTIFRDASAEVKNLKIGKTEPDELNIGRLKQKLSFTLLKGSFATMALKVMEKD